MKQGVFGKKCTEDAHRLTSGTRRRERDEKSHWPVAGKRAGPEDASTSAQLQVYIDQRLLYGLGLVEDLSGILHTGNCVAYSRAVAGDTFIDTLGRAATQVSLGFLEATGFVINVEDWETIRHTKDSQGKYILGDPADTTAPQIWGLPVVATQSMAKNTFLAADFQRGAQIWDRQQAMVEVSREDRDNFVKNLVTVLAEERLAMTLFRPAAFVKGAFTAP